MGQRKPYVKTMSAWAMYIVILAVCILCAAAYECPEIRGKAIPVEVLDFTPIELRSSDFLHLTSSFLSTFAQLHEMLIAKYDVGLQLSAIRHTYSEQCETIPRVDEYEGILVGIFYQTTHCRPKALQAWGDMSSIQIWTEEPTINIEEHFRKLSTQFKLDDMSEESCTRLQSLLTTPEQIPFNGVVEGTEQCDVLYASPVDASPCVNQVLSTEWTRINYCRGSNGCELYLPTAQCSYKNQLFDARVCSTHIGLYSIPFEDGAETYEYNNVTRCIDVSQCNDNRFTWGIEIPIDDDDDTNGNDDGDDETTPSRFYPIDEAIMHAQYLCYINGDITRPPHCFPNQDDETMTLRRPTYPHSCRVLLDYNIPHITVDTSFCLKRGDFTVPPCDYNTVLASFPSMLPTCYTSLCTAVTADNEYEGSQDALQDTSLYRFCASDPEFGFADPSTVECSTNAGKYYRKAFCIYIDQSMPDAYPYYEILHVSFTYGNETEDYEESDQCRDNPNIERQIDCQYDWMCSELGGGATPHACVTCETLPCRRHTLDEDVDTIPQCYGWKPMSSEFYPITDPEFYDLCNDEQRNYYPDPPLLPGTQCPDDRCTYESICESDNGISTSCAWRFYYDLMPYMSRFCLYDDENATCGDGLFDPELYTTQCGGRSPSGELTPVQTEKCDNVSFVFPCYHPCEESNDWYCSVEVTPSDTPIPGDDNVKLEKYSCKKDTILAYMTSLQLCGDREFTITLKCDGVGCDENQKPSLFPGDSTTATLSHKYWTACKKGCIDMILFSKENPGKELTERSTLHPDMIKSCTQFAAATQAVVPDPNVYLCAADSPCTYGLSKRRHICYDTVSMQYIGDIGKVDDLRSCQPSPSDDAIPTQGLCVHFDETECEFLAIPHLRSFDLFTPTQSVHPGTFTEIDPDTIALIEKYQTPSASHNYDDVLAVFGDYVNYVASETCGRVALMLKCYLRPPGGLPDGYSLEDFGKQFPDNTLLDGWLWYPNRYCRQHVTHALQFDLLPKPDVVFGDLMELSTMAYGYQLATVFGSCSEWQCATSAPMPLTVSQYPSTLSDEHGSHQPQSMYSLSYPFPSSRMQNNYVIPSLNDETSDMHALDLYKYSPELCDADPKAVCPSGCGRFLINRNVRCFVPDLTINQTPELQILGGISQNSECSNKVTPTPQVECNVYSTCARFAPHCRLRDSKQGFSPENCSSSCDFPLCGRHVLDIKCMAYPSTTNPNNFFEVPLELCDVPKELENVVCENYLDCTQWGCTEFLARIDDEDHTSDGAGDETDPESSKYTKSKYTITSQLCSRDTPLNGLSSATCSSSCGKGTMERKVVCLENGRILRNHDPASQRCGLYYARPVSRLVCEIDERLCQFDYECNVGGSSFSTTLCRWSQQTNDCLPMCALDPFGDDDDPDNPDFTRSSHPNPAVFLSNTDGNSSVMPYIHQETQDVAKHNDQLDIVTRCVYRNSGGRQASTSSCPYTGHVPPHFQCQVTGDACCWNPNYFSASNDIQALLPPQCRNQMPLPSGVSVFETLSAGQPALICSSGATPIAPTPQEPLDLNLDEEVPLCWHYTGPTGMMVSIYLRHPQLQLPYFVNSYPAQQPSMSFLQPKFTLSSDEIPILTVESGATNSLQYASLEAVINGQVYGTLQYIVINPTPAHIKPKPPPASYNHALCGDKLCFNGQCVDNTCQCYGGFTGSTCSQHILCAQKTEMDKCSELGNGEIVTTGFEVVSFAFEPSLIANKHTASEQDEALDQAIDTVTSKLFCPTCRCVNYFTGDNCGTCALQCSAYSFGPNERCSQCVCKAGYYGEQCNCRRTYLPMHYARAPSFLETHFDDPEANKLDSRTLAHWKRILVNDLALDLQLSRETIDIDTYGYNKAGKHTTFVVVFMIETCLPYDLTSQEEIPPGDTYRLGNMTDLAMVAHLFQFFTQGYASPENVPKPPIYNRDNDPVETAMQFTNILAVDTMLSSIESFLSEFLTDNALAPTHQQIQPHTIMQTVTKPSLVTTEMALQSPSAPFIQQKTYFTPSQTANGPGQSLSTAFAGVGTLVDEDCPYLASRTQCWGDTKRPTLVQVPYSKASKTPIRLTLILLLVFCLVLPIIIIVGVTVFCWWKKLLCFAPKPVAAPTTEPSPPPARQSFKSTQKKSRRPKPVARSGSETQLADMRGRKTKRGIKIKSSSVTHASPSPQRQTLEMVEIRDPALHPDWKKFMGPHGEPIYVNSKTFQSSRVRPDKTGSIRKKSLFHRPTVFAGNTKVPSPRRRISDSE